jgi:hypothetical protein
MDVVDLKPPSSYALFQSRLAGESMTENWRYILIIVLELTVFLEQVVGGLEANKDRAMS